MWICSPAPSLLANGVTGIRIRRDRTCGSSPRRVRQLIQRRHHEPGELAGEMTREIVYHGIDGETMAYDFKKCDECGGPLTEHQYLCGLCRACEEAAKIARRPAETVKPSRGRTHARGHGQKRP